MSSVTGSSRAGQILTVNLAGWLEAGAAMRRINGKCQINHAGCSFLKVIRSLELRVILPHARSLVKRFGKIVL